ncbi:DUF4907 domain-containing protein [Bacteroides ovatus]|nr:DUF4907 domain-containing protein [Bacteroides ovatus]
MHSINIYRLEVTQIEGSGYGYKIYERERLIIVQPFIPVVSGKRLLFNRCKMPNVSEI